MTPKGTVQLRILAFSTFLIVSAAPSIASSESSNSIFIKTFNDTSKNNDMDICVMDLLRTDFTCNAFLSFAYSKSDVNKLIEAINKDKCYTTNVRSFVSRDWLVWNEIYIIMTTNFTELNESLIQLQNESFWNPRAYFVVASQNVPDGEVQTLFQQFLIHKMYKVVFLNQENAETQVYTYRPFHVGNCGMYVEDIDRLGSCTRIRSGYFPKNITRDLKNCKFKAVKYSHSNSALNTYTKLPILEQYILDTFTKFSNYSIQYNEVKSEINYGVVLPNRTVTGLLGHIHRNAADIAVGSTVVIKNRADVFDFICGIKVASFKLFTSTLGKETWKKVYTEFDSETWLLILSCYVLMVVVCILFLNMSPKIPYSHTYLIIKIWGFFYLGNGTEPYAKTQRLRLVTALWIWFTFFISSFYNSDMYSLITGHIQRKREIDPSELSTIPYEPCISTVINTFFFFAYNVKLPKSLDIQECRTIDGAFKAVADNNDLYTIQLKDSYLDREKDFIDSEGNRKLDAWEFSSDIVLGFYITKGFPVKDKLQMHAQRMFETGLIENYRKLVNPSSGAPVDHRRKNVTERFVLGDFRVHFGVLVIGTILSTLTFAIEILYKRKHTHALKNMC